MYSNTRTGSRTNDTTGPHPITIAGERPTDINVPAHWNACTCYTASNSHATPYNIPMGTMQAACPAGLGRYWARATGD